MGVMKQSEREKLVETSSQVGINDRGDDDGGGEVDEDKSKRATR